MDSKHKEELKLACHLLANRLQEVIGWLELDQSEKALAAVKQAAKELREMAKLLARACVSK